MRQRATETGDGTRHPDGRYTDMSKLLTIRGAAAVAAVLLTGCASTTALLPRAVGAPAMPSHQRVIQESVAPALLDTPEPQPSAIPTAIPAVATPPPARPLPARTLPSTGPVRPPAPHPAIRPALHTPVAVAQPLREPSGNWSGYMANGDFGEVAGMWTEPTVRCTAPNATLALWVGLGGDRTLPLYQAGSGVICRDGTPTHILWYELLTPAQQPPQVIVREISPGDAVSASVNLRDGSGGGVIHLADRTTGWATSIAFAPQSATLGTAEWIAEATTSTANGQVTPLADFGTVGFSACSANQGTVGLSSWPVSRLTELLLHDVNGGSATPGAVTTDAAGPAGGAFSVTYGR
jgi:hypothetical protein